MSAVAPRVTAGRRRLPRAAAVAMLAIVLAVVFAQYASAYHRADNSTRKAMQGSLSRTDCGGTRHVADAYVSTADPHYGLAYCGGGGHFANVLRRSGREDWRVAVSIGDGIQPCSVLRRHVPGPVLRDLRIGGLTSSGAERIC